MSEGYSQTISTAELSETPRLSLEQATGDVRIEGWDRPEIKITSSDENEGFEVEQVGSQIIVRSKPIKFDFNFDNILGPAKVELENMGVGLEKVAARVERQVQRRMRHASHRIGRFAGNIDLGRWAGGRDYFINVPHDCDLTLRTSTGDLSVEGVTGTLLLQSTAGDTHLKSLDGNILVSSASGDVSLTGIKGKLGVRSASGDINVRSAELQELSASAASGDLNLDLTKVPEREFELKTVSGDVNLRLPREARLTAEVSTFSGDIGCSLPHEKSRKSAGRTTTLVINGGGPQARFASVSGDVSIRASNGRDAYDYDDDTSDSDEDIREPEGRADRRQSELEILQALERGEITSQQAMQRLSEI